MHSLRHWLLPAPARPFHPLRSALLPLLVLAMGLLLAVFRQLGEHKPWGQWNFADILGEGGMVAMSNVWLYLMVSGRPAGRVTTLLALGLAMLSLGFWVDFLDEFFRLPKTMLWDNWLESSLTPLGMAVFTYGLVLWRQEQRALNERLLKRERLFRDHRGYDAVTQLADAGYMAAQIDLQRTQGQATVVMLGLPGHAVRAREQGPTEAERVLQAVSLLLLLNLPADALLCRYAADRFCLLLPGIDGSSAKREAERLGAAVQALHHHTLQGASLPLRACTAWADLNTTAASGDALLRQLQQRLPS